MFNYKLTLQYDGTRYSGWQIQENAVSVQEVLKNSIQKILQSEINIIGAGRTDAGVHALGQVANFTFDNELDLYKFKYSLNSVLPDDISVLEMIKVDEDFHARFSAKKRSYIYLISSQKSPFFDRYSYNYYTELHINILNELSKKIIGDKDFTSFSKNNPEVQNKNCEIFQARWRREKNLIIFYIEANRFLYGMVRAIVGSLIKIHSTEKPEEELMKIIEKRNRSAAADSVPAKGLFLYKIKY